MTYPRRYAYHLRAHEDLEKVERQRAMLGWRILHKGGATVIAQQNALDSDWRVGVAMCSPTDRYRKRTGMGIAATRLASDYAGKQVHNVVRVENGCSPVKAALSAVQTVVGRYFSRASAMEPGLARERLLALYGWFAEHLLRPLEARVNGNGGE